MEGTCNDGIKEKRNNLTIITFTPYLPLNSLAKIYGQCNFIINNNKNKR